MKFISIIALLAPAALAAPGDAWITLIKQECPDVPDRCIDIAKEVHRVGADVNSVVPAVPGCNPSYIGCIQDISGDSGAITPFPSDVDQQKLSMCLSNIAPNHIKYFLDNDSADIPIPVDKNCVLRELHRVTHVELGPLA